MDKMPQHIRVILSSLDIDTLDELALRADKIIEIQNDTTLPFNKFSATDNASLFAKLKTLEDKITTLSSTINTLRITDTKYQNLNKLNNHTQSTRLNFPLPLVSQQSPPKFIPTPIQHCNSTRKTHKHKRQNLEISSTNFNSNSKIDLSSSTLNVQPRESIHDLGNIIKSEDGNQMLSVFDPLTKIKFTVDTGSQFSILPSNRDPSHPTYSGSLRAANGTDIPTFDSTELRLSLNMDRIFSWRFRYAKIRTPILGLDFLRHYNLNIDIKNNRLINCEGTKIPNKSHKHHKIPTPIIASKDINSIDNLCNAYSFLFDVTKSKEIVPGQTMHYIRTTGSPVSSKVRRLSPERLAILKKELQKLLDLEIISPGNSPYASPVHLVPKKKRSISSYRGLSSP